MDRSRRMLRRRVEGVQLQVTAAGVHNVVPDAGGDDDCPVVLDIVRLLDPVLRSAELEATLALLDPEELVEVR
jgi:hypothetical protein